MIPKSFQALVVHLDDEGRAQRRIETRTVDGLPEGSVLVRVHYSSLNYKDALSATGNRGVTKSYPHTPGIDAAGTVAHSDDAAFAPGDAVLVTGFDLGMNTDGGFGQYVRVPADWVLPLPEGLSLKESMIFGTAGLTAGIGIHYLREEVAPDDGPVLVTGATGGVGSLAVAILARLGYKVAAVSGKPDAAGFLTGLGAAQVLDRSAVMDASDRPLLKGRWAGVLDTVGGEILATAIRSAQLRATVTCCGNVASPRLPLTVFPFILRGVRLIGIDSQHSPMDERRAVWRALAGPWKIDDLDGLATEIALEGLVERIDAMINARSKGRVVVRLTP